MTERMKFSDEFRERPAKEQIEYLMSLCSSQNQALDLMQQERDKLIIELKTKESQLIAADNNVTINKNIMINSLTAQNKEKEIFILRIQDLEKILRDNNLIQNN